MMWEIKQMTDHISFNIFLPVSLSRTIDYLFDGETSSKLSSVPFDRSAYLLTVCLVWNSTKRSAETLWL